MNEFRAWRGAVRMGDGSGAESWRTFLAADSIGLLIVLAFGVVINHSWLLLRGRKTKKITTPKASTIKSPMESAAKKVRQLSAPDPSPIPTAPRQDRNS